MAACAVTPGVDASTQLVVRNSFLELFDDMPALGPVEPQRPRAMTDITGTRMPRSDPLGYEGPEDFHEFLPVLAPPAAGLLGDGLRREGECLPGHEAEQRLGGLGDGSARPMPSEPQYAHMSSGAGMMPVYAAPWGWGYPPHGASAAGLNPMANCFWGAGYGPGNNGQQGGGAGGFPAAKPPAKAKAKAKAPQSHFGADVAPAKATEGQSAPAGAGAGNTAAATAPKVATQSGAPTQVSENATTVMLRNIPNRYTQGMLLQLLDDNNFLGRYDFVYLPMDFRNAVNLGYAFVNLLTNDCALALMSHFQGFAEWMFESSKVCEVSWAHPHQGLGEHVERYRNSPVMHPSMPDEYKPMVFQDGVRVPFPQPTKAIRAPKLRPVRDRAGAGEEPKAMR